MRCIGTDGVDFSHLAHSPPHLHHHHRPGLDDVTMASTLSSSDDVINPAPPHSPSSASSDSVSSSHDSSSPASPPFSPVSSQSESDLAGGDPPDLKDFITTTRSLSPRFILPQKFSSVSSPELNTLTVTSPSKRQSSPGLGSMTPSSLLGVDSGSESSPTSTARNTTLSSCSSLNTVADELSSRVTSSSEILNSPDMNEHRRVEKTPVKAEARKLSDSCVRFEGITTSDRPKRHHPLLDALLQKQKAEGPENCPTIQLPERYRHALRKSGSYGNIGSSSNSSRKSSSGGGGDEGEEDVSSREKDLGTALAWIRHEMVQMKEQDKVLLKRFIELRASILQLRCMYGSSPEIGSMDGSTVSLNEVRKSARMRNADSDAMLAERMYTASSSLSLPCSPQLSRLRWRSDELM